MKITLDGRVNADLDWTKEKRYALETSEELIWILDLGLFSRLKNPLSHKSQHLSLRLSLEHFRDEVWSLFQSRTKKIVLYQGSLDFSQGFPWSGEQSESLQFWIEERFETVDILKKETGVAVPDFSQLTAEGLTATPEGKKLLSLFCSDVCADYLELLVTGFPDTMPFSIELEAMGVADPWLEAALRNRARFPSFQVEVANSSLLLDDQACVAVLFPPKEKVRPSQHRKLVQAMRDLGPFRLIPEEFFLSEWGGLDYVIVASQTVDLQQKRKLQGFCAAGGIAVTLGDSLGLGCEQEALLL